VYDQTVAKYRQTVLDGFREVENYLVQLKVYEDEAAVRQEALDAARDSLRLTENQYKAGLIAYIDVVVVQATALSNERSVLNMSAKPLDRQRAIDCGAGRRLGRATLSDAQ
jgi:outer membrane protein TolC